MAELMNNANDEKVVEIEKQFNDRSYNGNAEESGMASASSDWTNSETNPTGQSTGSSGYDSGETGWEDYEGEIVNLSTFKLECLQSSNIGRSMGDCELSSIAHENGTPFLRKGNLERKMTIINLFYLDGKYNSTTIKTEKDKTLFFLWKI